MQLHISIDNQSTAGELLALAAFAENLADERALATDTAPDIPTPAAEPKNEPVRRGRGRNKGATEPAAPAAAEPAAQAPAAAEPAAQAPAASEPAAPAAGEPAAPAAADNEWEHTSKTYTEADVQALATVVARAHGPDVVKEKIAELGGARIADLDAAKLNALGAFLETKK